MKFQALFEAV